MKGRAFNIKVVSRRTSLKLRPRHTRFNYHLLGHPGEEIPARGIRWGPKLKGNATWGLIDVGREPCRLPIVASLDTNLHVRCHFDCPINAGTISAGLTAGNDFESVKVHGPFV